MCLLGPSHNPSPQIFQKKVFQGTGGERWGSYFRSLLFLLVQKARGQGRPNDARFSGRGGWEWNSRSTVPTPTLIRSRESAQPASGTTTETCYNVPRTKTRPAKILVHTPSRAAKSQALTCSSKPTARLRYTSLFGQQYLRQRTEPNGTQRNPLPDWLRACLRPQSARFSAAVKCQQQLRVITADTLSSTAAACPQCSSYVSIALQQQLTCQQQHSNNVSAT